MNLKHRFDDIDLKHRFDKLKSSYISQFDVSNEVSDPTSLNCDTGWMTGKVYLKGIRTEIDFSSKVRYRDSGEGNLKKYNTPSKIAWGHCKTKYNWFFNILQADIYIKKGLTQTQKEFVRGHEETHALVFLGHLVKFYEESKKLGLSFDFLSQETSQKYDKKISELRGYWKIDEFFDNTLGTEEPFDDTWGIGYLLHENLANMGGLMALIKSGADYNLISIIKSELQKGEFNLAHLFS